MKENFKKETKKEIIKLNEQINNLQNEIEIKEQKEEQNNVKYNNLQLKYLKMIHDKKKAEQDNLLMISMKLLNNKSKQFIYQKPNSNINNNSDINVMLPVLRDKNNTKTVIKNIEKEE